MDRRKHFAAGFRGALLAGLLVATACAPPGDEEPIPAPWSAPDLLVVDYAAGLFRHDVETGELTHLAGRDDGLYRNRRAYRLDDGRIAILASGEGPEEGRGLFLYDDGARKATPWIDLAGEWSPNDVVQVGPKRLLVSARHFEKVGDTTRKTSAIFEVDIEAKTKRPFVESPEFVSVLSLCLEEGGKSVLVLDGDANPRGLETYEGVLFRIDLDTRALTTVHVFENTMSPFQLHPLAGTPIADQAQFLLTDINAAPPPQYPWVGALFLLDLEAGDVRPFIELDPRLIDPIRGFIHDGRLLLAELSTNPGGYDEVDSEISYARFRGRGAIYSVDLATREIVTHLHDSRFIDPADVLSLE